MNILILTASNPMKAAGIVANDFFNNYSSVKGYNVKMVVCEYGVFNNDNIIVVQNRFEKLMSRIFNRLHIIFRRLWSTDTIIKNRTDENYYFLDFDVTKQFYSTRRILKGVDFKPDNVIIFFMHGFLTFKNISEIYQLTGAKIGLYMMDMFPITGGCHYSWGCKGYVYNCNNCPAILSKRFSSQASKNLESIKKYSRNVDLTVVAASEYQYRQLLNANVFDTHRKGKVLIGVDPATFNTGSKSLARKNLNLPTDIKIIFFGAVTPSIKRKGFNELVSSLNHLIKFYPKNEVHLAIAGVIDNVDLENLPFNYTCFGNVTFPKLAEIYRSADLFLCPSIEDSGPMMINQAIMAGLPTVSFDIGVAMDLIINGQTGYRVEVGNAKDMAVAVLKVIGLEEMEYNKLVENCRSLGLTNLNLTTQFWKFNNLVNG